METSSLERSYSFRTCFVLNRYRRKKVPESNDSLRKEPTLFTRTSSSRDYSPTRIRYERVNTSVFDFYRRHVDSRVGIQTYVCIYIYMTFIRVRTDHAEKWKNYFSKKKIIDDRTDAVPIALANGFLVLRNARGPRWRPSPEQSERKKPSAEYFPEQKR